MRTTFGYQIKDFRRLHPSEYVDHKGRLFVYTGIVVINDVIENQTLWDEKGMTVNIMYNDHFIHPDCLNMIL